MLEVSVYGLLCSSVTQVNRCDGRGYVLKNFNFCMLVVSAC